jgi:hypothetical protein
MTVKEFEIDYRPLLGWINPIRDAILNAESISPELNERYIKASLGELALSITTKLSILSVINERIGENYRKLSEEIYGNPERLKKALMMDMLLWSVMKTYLI